MAISREEAIQRAFDLLSSRLENRLHIVDEVLGVLYGIDRLDLGNCWIIYVQPEVELLDGRSNYILVNKKTGIVTEIST